MESTKLLFKIPPRIVEWGYHWTIPSVNEYRKSFSCVHEVRVTIEESWDNAGLNHTWSETMEGSMPKVRSMRQACRFPSLPALCMQVYYTIPGVRLWKDQCRRWGVCGRPAGSPLYPPCAGRSVPGCPGHSPTKITRPLTIQEYFTVQNQMIWSLLVIIVRNNISYKKNVCPIYRWILKWNCQKCYHKVNDIKYGMDDVNLKWLTLAPCFSSSSITS